jgi:transposase-like protein
LLKGQGREPRWLVTDKLRSYDAAHRTIMPMVPHINKVYANNRAEVSHEPTRQRERAMRRFKSPRQAQEFLTLHASSQLSAFTYSAVSDLEGRGVCIRDEPKRHHFALR